MKKNTYKIALFGMLSAVALVLSFIEGMIPLYAALPPGAKAGFSNIATMFAASNLGLVPALAISLIKALFAGVTRGFTAGIMSLAGGMLSTLTMYLLFRFSKNTSYILIGVMSALMHNSAQLIVSTFLVGTTMMLAYAPVLLISGIITGTITGTILKAVIPHLNKLSKKTFKGGK